MTMRPIELSGLTADQLDHLERTAPAGWKIDRIMITDPAGKAPAKEVGYLRIPDADSPHTPVPGLVPWLAEGWKMTHQG